MAQQKDDMAAKLIHSSPDILLKNPPRAIFATGTQDHVDLFGELSVVALKNPTEMIVQDPLEDRQAAGIIDTDTDGQIADIRFMVGQIDTEDPVLLKKRIVKMFRFIERNKLFLHGMLELEANAFGSSIFVDVEPEIINKLEAVHKHFRDGKTIPIEGKSEDGKSTVAIRFIGRYGSLGKLWPRQEDISGKNFIVSASDTKGHVAGIVAENNGVAEFIILSDTLSLDAVKVDWIVMKQLLEEFKLGKKKPIAWFKWSLGMRALANHASFQSIKDDPDINNLINEYNKRISKIIIEYYKDAGIVGNEFQIDLTKLSEREKQIAADDLQGAIKKLDELYKETEKT